MYEVIDMMRISGGPLHGEQMEHSLRLCTGQNRSCRRPGLYVLDQSGSPDQSRQMTLEEGQAILVMNSIWT